MQLSRAYLREKKASDLEVILDTEIQTMDYIEDLKKELPYIKPGEEDDFAIEEAGQDAYPALLDVAFMCNMPVYGGSSKAGDLKTAELKFKELVLAQPKHHSGCEYLAMLYGKTGQREKAVWFQERAIVIARKFLEDDSIDMEVIREMEGNLEKIKNGVEVLPWWRASREI
jgi:hypothetical protein